MQRPGLWFGCGAGARCVAREQRVDAPMHRNVTVADARSRMRRILLGIYGLTMRWGNMRFVYRMLSSAGMSLLVLAPPAPRAIGGRAITSDAEHSATDSTTVVTLGVGMPRPDPNASGP